MSSPPGSTLVPAPSHASPTGQRKATLEADKEKQASGSTSPNSSFSGSSLNASTGSLKRTKEEAKRDKEEEKNRKREEKKEKEREKLKQTLGLPETEKILHEFSCAAKKGVLLTGRLYVTPFNLHFKYSLGSSLETIPLKDIVELKKELTYFVPNAILVRTADGKEHFFGSLLYREQAWNVLNVVINNAKSDKPMDAEALHKATKAAKKLATANQKDEGLADEGAAAVGKIDLGPEDEFTQRMWGPAPEASVPLPADSPYFRDSSKAPVVDVTLPVPLRTFWRLFLADPSTFSVEIHTLVKDFDIKVGPWATDGGKQFYTRTLTFQTPIQSRLVRRTSCDVRMVQRLLLRSPRELLLDTSNFITGTPYAEDFTVEAKWRAQGDEADRTTHLVVFLEMNWIKAPMGLTKSMIDKASLGGAGAMVESWAKLARQKIAQLSGAKAEEAEEGGLAAPGEAAGGRMPKALLTERALTIFAALWALVLFLMLLYTNAKLSALALRLRDLERTWPR